MHKLETLKQKVAALYNAETPGRDDWTAWFWAQHVPAVAKYAREVAGRVGANAELAEAAAWLHDIADVKMSRMQESHEAESLRLAHELMAEAGYNEADTQLVVEDALRWHSCYDGRRPDSLEGKVLATADALAHLKTDCYVFFVWALGREMGLEDVKAWALKKAERDFTHKICFDDIREETRPHYEQVKGFFGRPPAIRTNS